MYGKLHCYIGDGKGKTTAAVGLAVRAHMAGLKVCMCQFLKDGLSAELCGLKELGIEVMSAPMQGFYMELDAEDKAATCSESAELCAVIANKAEELDLLVLDEFLWAVTMEILPEELVRCVLDACAGNCELVLTGACAPDWILERADYLTEMNKLRHPFDLEVPPRSGIEF
ncbi:MAG: cob(I)yrinic acid a,c-diamide adenosyltransferase [Oscillospiraceae bacterium]|nr:cob(I)yrinic acid a,c-diamide adenosyltransferase [Oscillospiraceae bacterium]